MTRVLPVVLLVALLTACAAPGAPHPDLASRDYVQMSDPELQSYYRQLNDQIARDDRALRQQGQVLFDGSARREERLEELLQRRNAVRSELARRGLLP